MKGQRKEKMGTKPLSPLKEEETKFSLNREVTLWLPILSPIEVKRQSDTIKEVPSTIKDLSTIILSKEDKSYMDEYLNLHTGSDPSRN